jgi:uncharacterized membrane protein
LVGLLLPDGAWGCSATAISGDGTTVVGSCSLGSDPSVSLVHGVKWTLAGGVQSYPLEGNSYASDVSHDGSVVVGLDANGPYVWAPEGVVHLGSEWAAPTAVSADGRVVVGGVDDGIYAGKPGPAYVWTAEGGARTLPASREGLASRATDVSADGTVIIGYDEGEDSAPIPLTWSVDGQVQQLPVLAPLRIPRPANVSRDGSIIVGDAHSPTKGVSTVARWTSDAVEVGPDNSLLRAMSADGSVTVIDVGASTVIWHLDPLTPLVRLDPGSDIGFFNLMVRDASDDGRVLTGSIQYRLPADPRPRAFVAWLP